MFALLASLAGAVAQTPSHAGLDPAAPTGAAVLDAKGVLERHPEVRRKIGEIIGSLERQHGFSIILVIEPFYLTADVDREAARLQELWLPKGDGLVIVFETDSNRIGVSRAMAEANENLLNMPSRVSPHVTLAIYGRVFAGLAPDQPPPDLALDLITRLGEEFEAHFTDPAPEQDSSRGLRVGLLLTGFLSILGLVILGFRQWLAREDARQPPTMVLPKVDVPKRLGAPYGGGVAASIRFKE